MKEEELRKYAELLIAISTDYHMGKIDSKHFVNMIEFVLEKLKS